MAVRVTCVCLLFLMIKVFQSTNAQTTGVSDTSGGDCTSTGSKNCTNPAHVCYEDTCVPFVGLGGACSRFDVCYHAPDNTLRLACVDNRCLIQVGQSCAENGDKCVTGAECNSSSLCQCAQGHVDWEKDQEQKCRRQTGIGLDCSDGADCVSADGEPDLTCDPYSSSCVLKEGRTCDNDTYIFCPTGSDCENATCTCVAPFHSDKGACAKTVGTVGGECGPEDRCKNDTLGLTMDCDRISRRCLIDVGQLCQGYEDLCTNGAICSNTSNTCVCSGNFTTSDSGKTCQGPRGTIGSKCITGNTCLDTAAICNDGYCLCEHGYNFTATNSVCLPGGSKGDGGNVNDGRNGGNASGCRKTELLDMLLFAAVLLRILLH